jgi:tetratricopeptide (TPR) repeat protein
MYYLARRYDEAVAQLRRTVELDPAAPLGHTALAGVYAVMGRCAEALAETAVAAGNGGAFSVAPGYVLAVCGRAPEARRELAGMLAQSRAGTYVAARLIADVYLGLGDRERFLSWFERAFDAHEPLFPTDPIYDPVRDDPRFVALEARWVK